MIVGVVIEEKKHKIITSTNATSASPSTPSSTSATPSSTNASPSTPSTTNASPSTPSTTNASPIVSNTSIVSNVPTKPILSSPTQNVSTVSSAPTAPIVSTKPSATPANTILPSNVKKNNTSTVETENPELDLNLSGWFNLKVGNNYCTDGQSGLHCDRETAGAWEKFKFTDVSNGEYTIKGSRTTTNNYCGLKNGGFTCSNPLPSQRYSITPTSPSTFSIQDIKTGKYCSANGANNIACNSDTIGQYEIFHYEGTSAPIPPPPQPSPPPLPTYPVIKSTANINTGDWYNLNLKNMYCTDGVLGFKCNRSNAGAWEKFNFSQTPDGYYTIKGNRTTSNNYCGTDNNGLLSCNNSTIGNNTKFSLIARTPYSMSAQNLGTGKYCTMNSNAQMVCDKSKMSEFSEFDYSITSPP